MSDVFLPSLAGLSWDVIWTPGFNTSVQRSVNLSEARTAWSATPVWDVTFTYDLLRDDTAHNELKQLVGFFCARQGSFDSWLYQNPYDFNASNQAIGTGDGTSTTFNLRRTIGEFSDRVSNWANAVVYANGVAQNAVTISTANGQVVFNSPPASGAVLTWTGSYYYRCRFEQDMQEFTQFNRLLWQARTFKFKANLGTKLAP